MFEQRENENFLLHVLRLAARGAGVVCLAILLFFFLGEGIAFEDVSAREWVGIVFFPILVIVGLIWAWREEILGGTLIVLGILGFYFVYGWYLSGSLRQGWAILPFVVPGVLFLLHGLLARYQPRKMLAN